MKNNESLPEALGRYTEKNAARFHMPGHKGLGLPIPPAWDVTELRETDNLHAPEGPIRRTEEAYREAFGCGDCFLLVGGSTAGNLAMLLALGEKKRVLLQRSAHRSALSGLALADHEAIPLFTPDLSNIEEALLREEASGKPLDAVFLVSPDYYGRVLDLPAIAELVHAHGALLLVDAAHGAHFPFSSLLPDLYPEAVDLFTVSAHKTLNAMTQSAVLCLGKNAPFQARDLRRILAMVESSSPSYPLMASLDWALHCAKGDVWTKHVQRILSLREEIQKINGLCLPENQDPSRLVIKVSGRGLFGGEAESLLYEEGIVVEMADRENLVLITSPADPEDWYQRLLSALQRLPYRVREALPNILPPPAPGKALLSPRKAMLGKTEAVEFSQCAGRICAAPAGLYPPGTALLFPGERIESDMLSYMERMEETGLSLFGVYDGRLVCVKEEN